MVINVLFDPKRRKEVQDAIQRGEDVFARKKGAVRKEAVEPITTGEGSKEDVRKETVGPAGFDFASVLLAFRELPPVSILDTDPPQFHIGARTYDANEYLELAIHYRDLRAAKEAVDNGADVNHVFHHEPAPPYCTDRNPTMLGFKQRTPLGYAKELGNAEMAEFLKKHGATE